MAIWQRTSPAMAPVFSRSTCSTCAKICTAVWTSWASSAAQPLRHRRFDFFRHAALAAETVDELLQLAFGQRSHEAIDRLAVDEGKHRGNRLNAHLLGELLVLVDIDLDHADLAVGLLDDFFESWPQLLARAAPRRPEIDDDRLLSRRLDDVPHEILGIRFLDQVACRSGCALASSLAANNHAHATTLKSSFCLTWNNRGTISMRQVKPPRRSSGHGRATG